MVQSIAVDARRLAAVVLGALCVTCASITGLDEWPDGAGAAGSGAAGASASAAGAGGSGASSVGGGGDGAAAGAGGNGICVPKLDLVGRWRADDIVGEEGTPVTTWPPTAGQPLVADIGAPTLVLDGIGGHAAVHFDGAGTRMSTTVPELIGDALFTVFIISQAQDTASSHAMFQAGDASAATAGFSFGFCDCRRGMGVEFDTWVGADSESHDRIYLVAGETPNPTLWTVRRGSSQLAVYRNGMELGTTPKRLTLDIVSDKLWIGGRGDGAASWLGSITEIVVYARSVAGAESADIEECLMNRYDLP
jgi:hypothetical protein